MRNLTPKQLAYRLSLLIAALITVLSSLLWMINYPLEWYLVVLTFLISFLTCYFIFLWGIRQFIDRKFRLIYKTIHNLKVGLKREPQKVDMSEDVFGRIRQEVIDWDKRNRKEIARLTDQEKFRREFLGNVSHELKTPIFSIQGYILTLLEGGLEDKKINRNFLLKAEKSINRMIEMVDDLDEISKLESNRMVLDIKRFDLLALTKEIIESLEYKAKKKKISLRMNTDQKNIFVKADPARISQVITNLLVNSINYGKEDGRTTVKFFDLDENVLVEVGDNGRGIEAEHLPRLFERFYRVDKGRSRSDGGSGLGLAIVKHIMEAHQQTINVRSKVGEGSVFSFTLEKA
ncbi:MAG: two-component sensor histidine kinase [Flavobacteriales bacterium]|nr:two-component sensor histidine kinase [Flavobacteriales bacterium]